MLDEVYVALDAFSADEPEASFRKRLTCEFTPEEARAFAEQFWRAIPKYLDRRTSGSPFEYGAASALADAALWFYVVASLGCGVRGIQRNV